MNGVAVRSEEEFVAAIRARVDALNVPHLSIDAVAGLAGGHTGKLLAPIPVKRFGPQTMYRVLRALGLTMLIAEDPEATKRIMAEHRKRERQPVPCQPASMMAKTSMNVDQIKVRAVKKYKRELAQAGGRARTDSLTPEQRSELSRRAALIRWSIRRRTERERREAKEKIA